jgi:GNAT superfamily N-acetyltransferase
MDIVLIHHRNQNLINDFLKVAGSSLQWFRYYNNRSRSVRANHVITAIGLIDGEPVAYGHLDREGMVTWLGLCVIDLQRRSGRGAEMLLFLHEEATSRGINALNLTVDEDNLPARSLYKKFGYKDLFTDSEKKVVYMGKKLLDYE